MRARHSEWTNRMLPRSITLRKEIDAVKRWLDFHRRQIVRAQTLLSEKYHELAELEGRSTDSAKAISSSLAVKIQAVPTYVDHYTVQWLAPFRANKDAFPYVGAPVLPSDADPIP